MSNLDPATRRRPASGAVANMFEQLGLRDAAGPFDWMRSDCQGITHLILNGFQEQPQENHVR